MRKSFAGRAAVLALLAITSGAHVLTEQPEKLTSCDADASTKGLTGAARKQFASERVKGS